MLSFEGCKIYLATGATDLRKSITGLVYLVEQEVGGCGQKVGLPGRG